MPTFHLQVVGLRDIQQIVSLGDLELVLLIVLVDKGDIDPRSVRIRAKIHPRSGTLTPPRPWAG